jgi:hypothetical protein
LLDCSRHYAVGTATSGRGSRAELVTSPRVLSSPERSEPDRADPELQHAIGRIAENGDRYLRVIYNAAVTPWRIVTACFDRGLRSEQ